MRICIVSIFINELYRKLIWGWIHNMRELFLPTVEREWYIVTDTPDHQEFRDTGLSLHLNAVPPGMGKQDIWRNKWKWLGEACEYAEKLKCTHVILAQSNIRCCRGIDEALFHRRMGKATNGNPVSIRHMIGLRGGEEVQAGLCWGPTTEMKVFSHFWRGRCEDDAWWQEACNSGLYDEYQLSSKYMKGDLKNLVGFADSGFSHDLQHMDSTWRPTGGDIEDRVMCTISKLGFALAWVRGGLGNMLFELAYTYTWAKKSKLIPTCSYGLTAGLRDRLFNFQKYFTNSDPYPEGTFYRLEFPTYVEDCTLHLGGYNIELHGYVQGIGGFKEQEVAIRQFLSPLAANETLIGTVGVHIRGSDYTWEGYELISKTEIKNSLIHHRYRRKRLYIFSDDLKLAHELMEGLDDGFEEVTWVVGNRAVEESCYNDFRLMSSMEVMICSASTYSWWACYLGRVKKVYWQNTEGNGHNGEYMYALKLPGWEYMDREDHGEKEECKLLVIIQTCGRTRDRRENCRETWLKDIPKGVKYFFCMGNPDIPYAQVDEDEDDMVIVKCRDDYYHLCEKTREMFCYADERYTFSHILKCDDDSYIRLDRALAAISDDLPCMSTDYFSGGGGYFLRHDVVREINRHLEYNFPGYRPEDIMVKETVENLGYERKITTRLCRNRSFIPFPENDQISCHYIYRENASPVEQFFSEECLNTCYVFFPPSCKAVLSLNKDGTYGIHYGKEELGTWKKEGDELILKRDDGEGEYRLKHIGNGLYMCDEFKTLSPLMKLTE